MPMLGYTEDERQKDTKKMKKFIENNPYPEYDKVIDIIRKDKIFRKEFMDMSSEYGTHNHQWMKEIYENIMDKEIVTQNGEFIYKRGSLFTMQMNYYTFIAIIKWFLHKSNMNENDKMFIHYNMKDLLSSYWNGVGEWRD